MPTDKLCTSPGAGKPDRVRQAVDLSGFRGAALNQSQCASAVYTGLLRLARWQCAC
ncbi:hypothetical protein QF20_004956 [Salmonella enterica subsp. enterica]|nr:hypothetical protein [Salmonella enterica subsp. enterica serovar Mikawasima]EDW0323319.1 hypothetical protein [Salmonella enterica subsp. enterica serovar Mikawasima]EDW3008104.1 hypothetical protein [Salmonella enterica subsp. enterica serovar Mikawasima]EEC0866733.1 hypothetical protein [Salmonella enterica subsp. enterica serovar Mikawasima]